MNLKDLSFIILDFDGVVTSTEETPGSYITHDNSSYGVSPGPFSNLMQLISDTGAKVIISSNWRKFDESGPLSVWNTTAYGPVSNPLPNLKKMLGDNYIGDFPKIRHMTKSQVLRFWFNENNIDSETAKYVIFDDDDREGYAESEFKDHYIKTNYVTGLTKQNCETAKEILKI